MILVKIKGWERHCQPVNGIQVSEMRKLFNSLAPQSTVLLVTLFFFHLLAAPALFAGEEDTFADEWGVDEFVTTAPENNSGMVDPLEPLNRVFFTFNDRLYFWILKPVATGYKAVISDEDVRMCFSNAFHNLLAPVRFVNNLLQGKVVGAGHELASFVINSTLGVAGLADPAHHEFGLTASDEDFGQTLGSYGLGNGFYICWPFLGPSSLRDTVGTVGDSFLDPLSYLTATGQTAGYALQGVEQVNKISLHIGEYEQFKEASFDPYVAVRNAYAQHRSSRVRDEVGGAAGYGVSRKSGETTEPATQFAGLDGKVLVSQEGLQGGPEILWENVGTGYFVLVGVYRDPSNIERQKERLTRVGRGGVVTLYQRDDYSFYGIEVPGGANFLTAKQTEQDLLTAGFQETMVVWH